MTQILSCPRCGSSVGIDCQVHGPQLASIYCTACRDLTVIQLRTALPVPLYLVPSGQPA